jgi:hypothetical protein
MLDTAICGLGWSILRNLFRSEYPETTTRSGDADGSHEDSLILPADQIKHIEMDEFRNALDLLVADRREALILEVPSVPSRAVLSIGNRGDSAPEHETHAEPSLIAIPTATCQKSNQHSCHCCPRQSA